MVASCEKCIRIVSAIEKEPTVMVAWEDEKEDTSDGEAVTAPSAAESNYPVTVSRRFMKDL